MLQEIQEMLQEVQKVQTYFERVKTHVKKHQVAYASVLSGVTFAGITWIIMRGVASQPISVAIGDTASGAIGVAGKRIVMNNVSFISSNRQGPPSWVVRCLETNDVFTSQKQAALTMNLSQPHISSHLNGLRDHVNGYHFERICLAA